MRIAIAFPGGKHAAGFSRFEFRDKRNVSVAGPMYAFPRQLFDPELLRCRQKRQASTTRDRSNAAKLLAAAPTAKNNFARASGRVQAQYGRRRP